MAYDYHINTCVKLLSLLVVLCLAGASAERTKTLDFDVKPGGVVQTFSAKLKKYKCTFTYACQGGTNEQWQMSVGLSDDEQMFSCSVWRPQGKSYLFFTQFKAEIKGAKIEYATAYVLRIKKHLHPPIEWKFSDNGDVLVALSPSQTAVGGQRDVALKEEEYMVTESAVTHREGKFHSELSKLTVIGRIRHDEL